MHRKMCVPMGNGSSHCILGPRYWPRRRRHGSFHHGLQHAHQMGRQHLDTFLVLQALLETATWAATLAGKIFMITLTAITCRYKRVKRGRCLCCWCNQHCHERAGGSSIHFCHIPHEPQQLTQWGIALNDGWHSSRHYRDGFDQIDQSIMMIGTIHL